MIIYEMDFFRTSKTGLFKHQQDPRGLFIEIMPIHQNRGGLLKGMVILL